MITAATNIILLHINIKAKDQALVAILNFRTNKINRQLEDRVHPIQIFTFYCRLNTNRHKEEVILI